MNALEEQADRFIRETGSIPKAADRLVEALATDDEIREVLYPRLRAAERRLLDERLVSKREAMVREYWQWINEARAKKGLPPHPDTGMHPAARPHLAAKDGGHAGRIVSPEQVLETRRALRAANPRLAGEGSIAGALRVHESTVHRVRRDHGLIPWPDER